MHKATCNLFRQRGRNVRVEVIESLRPISGGKQGAQGTGENQTKRIQGKPGASAADRVFPSTSPGAKLSRIKIENCNGSICQEAWALSHEMWRKAEQGLAVVKL